MKKIKLIPLIGIEIENIGIIQFGQNIYDIKMKLGDPDSQDGTELYYTRLNFRIDLNEKEIFEFVEFQGPYLENMEVSVYNINPFAINADELLEILALENNGEIDDSEAPYCYSFMNISIGIWREFTEKDILDTIEKMKVTGNYEESREWLNKDLEKSKHFWSIGLGMKDYYKL